MAVVCLYFKNLVFLTGIFFEKLKFLVFEKFFSQSNFEAELLNTVTKKGPFPSRQTVKKPSTFPKPTPHTTPKIF